MDGLSVAESVAGLLQVDVKVIKFLSNMADTLAIVREVIAEVRAMRIIFRRLETFIINFSDYNQDRMSGIDVDDLVTILTGCVCTFFEIDGVLEGCTNEDGDRPRLTFWDRARWAAKEQDLTRMLRNLQSHKSSLILLLSMWVYRVCQAVRFNEP